MFFELWTDNIPSEVKDTDTEAQSLEFYLHIHFTIFPLRRHPGRHVCGSFFIFVVFFFLDYPQTKSNYVFKPFWCYFSKCPLSCATGFFSVDYLMMLLLHNKSNHFSPLQYTFPCAGHCSLSVEMYMDVKLINFQ